VIRSTGASLTIGSAEGKREKEKVSVVQVGNGIVVQVGSPTVFEGGVPQGRTYKVQLTAGGYLTLEGTDEKGTDETIDLFKE
jgi:hypothetical protein